VPQFYLTQQPNERMRLLGFKRVKLAPAKPAK
jgi:hypothetical protein